MENRIRELREESKMTQVRLSIELEISQETVSAYERNIHYPSIELLMKMVKLFHASSDYILGISAIRNPVEPRDLSGPELLLLEQYRTLPSQKQEVLKAYMLGLLA